MIITSAPAKIILFGEHAVNRQQPAIATAISRRTRCLLTPRPDLLLTLHSGEHLLNTDSQALVQYAREIETLRAADDRAQIRQEARDFFAPTKYVLGTFFTRFGEMGADIEWHSEIPPGSGLGSGAAASSALVLALARAREIHLAGREMAELAWHGDIIAHGGIASGLDSGACTLGGMILYSLTEGPYPLNIPNAPTLVIGDTQVRANTAKVNARVNALLVSQPDKADIFLRMGELAQHALHQIESGEWSAVGQLMNQNQIYLREIRVSSPELEELVGAAERGGALGAKLSGAGGGGVMVALATPETQKQIAQEISDAGGAALCVQAAVPGVREEYRI